MKSATQKYLQRRADLDARPLVVNACDGVDLVVVIPVLAERNTLFHTLEDLAANPPEELARTLVICVVNNREEPHASADDIAQNAETLDLLQGLAVGDSAQAARLAASPLRLGYIDAASPGYRFGPKEGVGLARKLGLDWGVAVLARNGEERGALLSLDADTRVEPSYLAAARAHFSSPGACAGIFEYAHPLDASSVDETRAIVCYELFLRYHTLGLKYAGSPYAFHTIGSTIGCTVEAYVAVSGMNRRQAGEDFYFLQKLAKTGSVKRIPGTVVYPSPRASHRVPFGTGARVGRFMTGVQNEYLLYHPESYTILREWLACAQAHAEEEAGQVLDAAGRIAPQLKAFLAASGFAETWQRLQRNSRDTDAFRRQFHVWFDGFRTLKLIHHLRDRGYPEQDTFQAIERLLTLRGDAMTEDIPSGPESNLQEQQAILCRLRAIDENNDEAGEPGKNRES